MSALGLALPLTYETHELSTGFSSIVYDAHGCAVDTHLREDEAEYFVKAVNAHDELVVALKDSIDALAKATDEDAYFVDSVIRRAKAILAKAGAL